MYLKFTKVRDVKSPSRANFHDAGLDFYIPNDFQSKILYPNTDILIPSGIKIEVPENHMALFLNKSGVSTKKKLVVGAQVIDVGYEGEVHIHLFNIGSEPIDINPGDKIIQLVLVPISIGVPQECKIENMYENKSNRGEGGFGSTDHI